MKKFFLMLGTWVVLIVAVIVGSTLYKHFKTSEYDAAATLYLEKVVPEISSWDTEKIKTLMAPEALEKIPQEQYNSIIQLFSRMGALQSMEKPKFSQIHNEESQDSHKGTIIEYTIDSHYENGEALITINLQHKNGQFRVYHFNLSAEALAQ